MKLTKSFCVLPWVQVATNTRGLLRLCCNSTPLKNLIQKNNTSLHISNKNLDEEYKNNQWLCGIRQKMLNAEKVDICERCYKEESSTGDSHRLRSNQKYQKDIDSLMLETNKDGSLAEFSPKYFDIRLGNVCNLKCRMCNPYSSKKWLEDWNLISKDRHQLSDETIKGLKKLDWFKDKKTWDIMSKYFYTAEEIYFTGGEPLLINEHVQLLESLIQEGASKNIKLKYNTNLTYLPNKYLELWKDFKQVRLNVSIDGYDKLNSYIRHPSEWGKIKNNLDKLHEVSIENSNFYVQIFITVQMYNLNKITEVYDFLRTYNGFYQVPYINILNHPRYLNIKCYTKKFKETAGLKLNSWLHLHENDYSQDDFIKIKKSFSDILSYMNEEDLSSNLKDFKSYTEKLDSLRGESLFDINRDVLESNL